MGSIDRKKEILQGVVNMVARVYGLEGFDIEQLVLQLRQQRWDFKGAAVTDYHQREDYLQFIAGDYIVEVKKDIKGNYTYHIGQHIKK